jgi:membrane-associated protease RseP (regulator of RpoE activity)
LPSFWQENHPAPFGFIRFFEPRDVGLEVDCKERSIVIREVKEGSPFAHHQIKPGAIIESINGQKFTSADGFRQTLRKAVAEEGGFFKIRHDDSAFDGMIRFPPEMFTPPKKDKK